MTRLMRSLAVVLALGFGCATAMAAATDDFSTVSTGKDSPLDHGALVTPSDGTDLTNVSRACLVGAAGNIKVTTVGGETFLITGVIAGQLLPMRFTRIWSSTTTASNISCWW